MPLSTIYTLHFNIFCQLIINTLQDLHNGCEVHAPNRACMPQLIIFMKKENTIDTTANNTSIMIKRKQYSHTIYYDKIEVS